MPDAIDPRRGDDAAPDWGAAFARLPLDTPPVDGLLRFSAAVQAKARQATAPRRDRRTTWAVVLASAAVLALVIGSPLLMRTPVPATPASGNDVAAQTSSSHNSQAPATMTAPTPGPSTDARQDAPASTELRLVQRALPGMERAFPESSAFVDRESARGATDRLIGTLPMAQIAAAADVATRAEALARLQQQSRQLEALIAMARDERVGTGAGVAMTGELDAVLARLDADLQRPDLDATQRVSLWQQRVETLEHLAGVTTTQRWLSAQGALDQVALVSVD